MLDGENLWVWVQGVCGLGLLLKPVLLRTCDVPEVTSLYTHGATLSCHWVMALSAFCHHPFPVSLPLTMIQSQDLILFPSPGILATPSWLESHPESSHVLDYSMVKTSWQGSGFLPVFRIGWVEAGGTFWLTDPLAEVLLHLVGLRFCFCRGRGGRACIYGAPSTLVTPEVLCFLCGVPAMERALQLPLVLL